MIQFETITLPIYYASWFVNGDNSCLDDNDTMLSDIEKTLKELNYTYCVDVSEVTDYKRFNGIGCEVCEYTFQVGY